MTWQRAGQHRVTLGGVQEKGGLDDRGLLKVLLVQALEGVEVRVVGPGLIVERVLEERERRQPRPAERLLVATARLPRGDEGDAEVRERLDPRAEDRCGRQVATGVDAAEAARAVEAGGGLQTGFERVDWVEGEVDCGAC